MALIKTFEHRPSANLAVRSEVECGWRAGDAGGRQILHLETYGSASRAILGKVSQSIELDQAGAAELLKIIKQAFPGIEAT